ncbi:MAG TPA: LysR substrate-binding domain-containing protein [Opitutaceae bacterium]
MELRHLRYFVAVAEGLNYRRAAERLHVAQPALSKQIKDLEDEVGARLMNRNTGGVALTDAGTVFLEEVRDILERVDMAVSAAREAEAGRGGRLIIGNLGALSASFLPAALSTFRTKYPHVDVTLHEMALPDQMAGLRAGTIQLAFTIDRQTAIPSDLECAEVLQSHVAVALGRDHPLARQTRVSLADLMSEQLLCVGETVRHDLHQKRIERTFAARGIRHRPIKRVNSFESLIALVAGDHGVSFLLPFASSPGTENVVFRRIKEDGDDLEVRLLAVWRKNSGSQLARNFVDGLRGHRAAAASSAAARAQKSPAPVRARG